MCGESNEILYVIKILDFNIGFNFFILSVLSKIDSFIFDFWELMKIKVCLKKFSIVYLKKYINLINKICVYYVKCMIWKKYNEVNWCIKMLK